MIFDTLHFHQRLTAILLARVMVSGSSASSSGSVLCSRCITSYNDFCVSYTGQIDLLVNLCQHHDVLSMNHLCVTCGELCRIDFNKKAFRCDKTSVTKGRPRKKCNYYKSNYNKTWFDHTKLDIETT